MAYDTPYRVETIRNGYQNIFEIHKSGLDCVASTHSVVMAHKIADLLNYEERAALPEKATP